MINLFPENSYLGSCSCGVTYLAPKGTLHCSNCLYKRIAELEKEPAKTKQSQKSGWLRDSNTHVNKSKEQGK